MKFDFLYLERVSYHLAKHEYQLTQNLSNCFVVSGRIYSHRINLHHLQINENQTVLDSGRH